MRAGGDGRSERVPDPVQYLTQVAATEAARRYKELAKQALDLHVGQIVLDIGCGPGADVSQLVAAVGPTESSGSTHDPTMISEARLRTISESPLGFAGATRTLPFRDASVDRARTDRVLQLVNDPNAVLAEVRRVLRPHGRAVFAEPDWDTLAIGSTDLAMSAAYREEQWLQPFEECRGGGPRQNAVSRRTSA